MKFSLSFFLILFINIPTFAQTDVEAKNAILSIMHNQQKAWNEGEIENFMIGYWQSDSLQFIGSSGIQLGWQKTLANYKKSYPNVAAMGKLEFSEIQIKILSDTKAFVIGRWKLTREKDQPKGFFTLLWEKKNGNWVITVDHSS
jgi:ketosteroid isomerase-like protein